MAISISSDLVLDVARAADPGRVAKAAAELNNGAPVGDSLAANDTGTQRSASFSSYLNQQASLRMPSSAANAPLSPETKAANELETLLLQQMIEAMLPKSDGPVFGKGTAGAVWRSMMAEHVARQVTASGEINLAQILTRKSGT